MVRQPQTDSMYSDVFRIKLLIRLALSFLARWTVDEDTVL